MYDYKEWKHIFKLDPNKEIDDKDLERICESGTDAIIIGGSDGVTMENVLALLCRVRRYAVPCALEVSNLESVTPGFDFYFIPTVLNSRSQEWIVGLHHAAIKEYGDIMNWDELVVEGYCVLNGESKVAQMTNAVCDLSHDDVIAYAQLAEHFYRLPIFYLEYSGAYGDVTLVKKVREQLTQTRLFYGGGIETIEQAQEMANYAHTIIVGNVIYDNIKEALGTVKAVKK